jgi:hypothetical protein
MAVQRVADFHGKIDSNTVLTVAGTIPASLPNGHLTAFVHVEGAGVTVSSVTWNGVGLGQEVTSTKNNTTGEAWRLVAPDTGAHDLVVTVSGAAAIEAGAIVCQYVDPVTPIHAAAAANGTGTSASISPAAVADGLSLNGVAAQEVGGLTQTVTADGGSTERWNEKTTVGSTADIVGAGATKPSSAGFIGTTWTLNNSADWVACTVNLNPSSVQGISATANVRVTAAVARMPVIDQDVDARLRVLEGQMRMLLQYFGLPVA